MQAKIGRPRQMKEGLNLSQLQSIWWTVLAALLSLGMGASLRAADPPAAILADEQPEEPWLSTGSWEVSAARPDGSTRQGILVVTRAQPDAAEGCVLWRPVGHLPETVESFFAIRTDDLENVLLWGYSSRALGMPSPPAVYEARLGPRVTDLTPIQYLPELRSSAAFTWTARHKSHRLPERAEAEGARLLIEGSYHRLFLQTLSTQYRIEGTDVWDDPMPWVLEQGSKHFDEYFAGLMRRKARLDALLEQHDRLRNTTDLALRFTDEVRRLALEQAEKWLTGQDQDYSQFPRIFAEGGAISAAMDREIAVRGISVLGHLGEQDLRERVRAGFETLPDHETPVEADSIEVRAIAEGRDVYLSLTNASGMALDNAIIMSEFHMDLASAVAWIEKVAAAELPVDVLVPFLGGGVADLAKRQALHAADVALLAVPAGRTIFVPRWEPGVTLEMKPGPSMVGLMECAEDGLVWIGSDQAILHKPLDLPDLREPIYAWALDGRPSRDRELPSEIYTFPTKPK